MNDEQAKELDAKMARYEGDYIESSDLMNNPPFTLTITTVIPPGTEKDKAKKLINKPIIAFDKAKKKLICGKTNEKVIKSLHGRKASDWIGKPITITTRYLMEAFGEYNVPTVRVIPPEGHPLPMGCRAHFGVEKPYTEQQVINYKQEKENKRNRR